MDDKGIEPGDCGPERQSGASLVKQFSNTEFPLEAGSLAIGDDGQISCSREDRALSFRFSACGIQFEAEIASKTAPLRLRANLGKLPYSAESPDARQMARRVLSATGRLRSGDILLTAEHDMMLEGELDPPSPRTPVAVVATAVALVLDFKPYLDLLGEAVAVKRQPPQPPQPPQEEGDGPAPAEA